MSEDSKDSKLTVTFAFSGETYEWNPTAANLLEFAESHGIEISAGCRYGDCGTCQTDLLAGEVAYLHATGVIPDEGTCLPCSCKPVSAVTLRA